MMKTWKKQTLWTTAAIALLGTTAMIVVKAGAADEKKPEASAKPALTVATVRPQTAELPNRLAANGNVAAWQETIIGAEVNGLRLTEVRVNVGDVVKRGQVLASFASESVDAELAQQKASVAEAEAALAEAQANAERARVLENSGALSKQQINQYLTAAKTAQARLEAARATYNSAGIRLRNTRVLAPDNGVISARAATVGAVLQGGQELFRMIRNNRLEWRAEVTAADLAKINPGQNVTVSTPDGSKVPGKVRMLAPTLDPQTRNAIVYVDLTPAANGGVARAGMYVKGEFELGKTAGVTVPQQALVVRDGYSYVFTVGPDKRVAQVKVKTGRRNGDRVEVIEGLKADAPVVATGAGFLNDGDLVQLAGAAGPQAAPARASQNK